MYIKQGRFMSREKRKTLHVGDYGMFAYAEVGKGRDERLLQAVRGCDAGMALVLGWAW